MARDQAPQEASAPYITPEGYQRLQQELDSLWQRRIVVTQALTAAAAEGDRSENAEYIYRKKQLREIDSRVRFLRKRLENMKVVNEKPSDETKVFFGAWVTLEDENGDEVKYRIVGPDEFDYQHNLISMHSPLAKALMGKSLDSDVVVETPQGQKEYYIVAIHYE